MEVLRAARERVDLDQVATDGLGERLQVRDRRDHAELPIRVGSGDEHAQRDERRADDQREVSHHCPPECLERMSGVRPEDERALEENLVDSLRAPVVRVGSLAVGPIGVLVREAEAEELRRPEGDVGVDGSLLPRVRRELRPVVPDARRPAPERLDLGARVPAEAVLLPLGDAVDDAVAVGVSLHEDATQRIDRLSGDRHEWVEPAVRAVLVAPLPAQERVALLLRRLAARNRHAELHRVLVAELEERPEPAGEERDPERATAEGGFVVAVEDAGEPLEIEGEVGHDRHLDALFFETLPAEEVAQHVRSVDPRQVVLVDHVRVPETVPHLAELGLGSERQREEGHTCLGELHTEFLAPRLLAGLDTNLCIRIRVHLAEEGELDLAREEAILLTGERPALGLLDVRLRDVADEIAGDPDVEEELSGAALLIQRKRLARPRQLGERHPRGRRRHGGRARRGGCGWRSHGGWLSLEPPEAFGHRLELLPELLDLLLERFGFLGGGRRSEEPHETHQDDESTSSHSGPPSVSVTAASGRPGRWAILSDANGWRRLAERRRAGVGEAERRADGTRAGQREREDEREHEPDDGRRVELGRGGPERRHEAQVVLLVPETELAGGVEVRETSARHDEGGEAQHQEERLAFCHDGEQYLTSWRTQNSLDPAATAGGAPSRAGPCRQGSCEPGRGTRGRSR